jgi:hypothetical protein
MFVAFCQFWRGDSIRVFDRIGNPWRDIEAGHELAALQEWEEIGLAGNITTAFATCVGRNFASSGEKQTANIKIGARQRECPHAVVQARTQTRPGVPSHLPAPACGGAIRRCEIAARKEVACGRRQCIDPIVHTARKASQVLPFHFAMQLAVTPPALVKCATGIEVTAPHRQRENPFIHSRSQRRPAIPVPYLATFEQVMFSPAMMKSPPT